MVLTGGVKERNAIERVVEPPHWIAACQGLPGLPGFGCEPEIRASPGALPGCDVGEKQRGFN